METANTSNKKLIIICTTIILVVAIVMTGVFIITKDKPSKNVVIGGMGNMIDMEMSYEDFTFGMKEDLSQEVMDEVKSLYDEFLQALENNDDKEINNVFEKLSNLEVYDEGAMQSGMIEISPEEFAKLDPDGDGIIVFDKGDLPDGVEVESIGGN
ncbi:MAG: hypothetical protein KAQ68_06580 [Clostridiales bacterium]|nr:hypothetical protein [Clostridiales bacterium]